MVKVIVGISSRTHTLNILDRMKESGRFQLHAPDKLAKERKLKKNSIDVDTIDEAEELILQGWHPRMRNVDTPEQAPDIIAPENVRIIEVPE